MRLCFEEIKLKVKFKSTRIIERKMKTIQILTIAILVSCNFADEAWIVDWSKVQMKPSSLKNRWSKPKLTRLENDKKNRIVGGSEVTPNVHPYQVGLLLGIPNTERYFLCGGSILNDRTILTAAHCTEGTDRVQVILGAHNITSTTESTQQRINANSSQYRCHFAYNPWNLNNDICIILLDQKIVFNDFVQPIELPRAAHLRERSFVTELATVT